MTLLTISFSAATTVSVLVVAIAFVAAPRSCEGGLELYAWSGVISLLVLGALPFLTLPERSAPERFAWALGFVAFGVVVWLAALFVANVRILCRLF